MLYSSLFNSQKKYIQSQLEKQPAAASCIKKYRMINAPLNSTKLDVRCYIHNKCSNAWGWKVQLWSIYLGGLSSKPVSVTTSMQTCCVLNFTRKLLLRYSWKADVCWPQKLQNLGGDANLLSWHRICLLLLLFHRSSVHCWHSAAGRILKASSHVQKHTKHDKCKVNTRVSRVGSWPGKSNSHRSSSRCGVFAEGCALSAPVDEYFSSGRSSAMALVIIVH